MSVAALVVIGVGVLLILAGLFLSVTEGRRSSDHPGVDARALGLSETIDALQRLVIALAGHPIGIRLIVLGIVCILVGGVLGGVAGLTA